MTFWFYMNGAKPGKITFFVRNLNTNEKFELWSEFEYDFGIEWQFGSFGFYINDPYIVLIEGKSANITAQGVIALDTIIFRESDYCSKQPLNALSTDSLPVPSKPITTTRVPQTTLQPPLYDCDFEKGFCNWEEDLNRPMKWLRIMGQTSSTDTGKLEFISNFNFNLITYKVHKNMIFL
jgi:hypothetical protein